MLHRQSKSNVSVWNKDKTNNTQLESKSINHGFSFIKRVLHISIMRCNMMYRCIDQPPAKKKTFTKYVKSVLENINVDKEIHNIVRLGDDVMNDKERR